MGELGPGLLGWTGNSTFFLANGHARCAGAQGPTKCPPVASRAFETHDPSEPLRRHRARKGTPKGATPMDRLFRDCARWAAAALIVVIPSACGSDDSSNPTTQGGTGGGGTGGSSNGSGGASNTGGSTSNTGGSNTGGD